jgi:hypothetical protein
MFVSGQIRKRERDSRGSKNLKQDLENRVRYPRKRRIDYPEIESAVDLLIVEKNIRKREV